MATKRDYEQLAKLKMKERELKESIKKVQGKILKNSPADEFISSVGTLKLKKRDNVSISNNVELIQHSTITKDVFIANGSIAIGTIKKLVGENGYNKLKKKGVVIEKEPTKYYELKAPPKNQEQL